MIGAFERFMSETVPSAMQVYGNMRDSVADIIDEAQWLTRTVAQITTEHFSERTATLVNSVFRATPFFIIDLVLPSSMSVLASVAIIAYKIIETPRDQPINVNDLENGLGLALLTSGLVKVIGGTANFDILRMVSGTISIGISSLIFGHTALFRNFFQ